MRFAAVYEKTPTGWSACAPDVPGLGVAGATKVETRRLLREAIVLHLEDLRASGQPTRNRDHRLTTWMFR
jgi:predicted RNase H-like HicB family nuclease